VKAFLRCALVGFILIPNNATAAVWPASTPVCQASRDARKLIGKRVRVEGYILNLSSHGFVLTSKRRDCELGQLFLKTRRVDSSPDWRHAFARSLGPKRAILVGTVQWEKARFTRGRNPTLAVERIVYLSQRDADPKDF
jgi:hypothetical protein